MTASPQGRTAAIPDSRSASPPATRQGRYPARGIGSLWEPVESSRDLTVALGTTRTRLLGLLEVPSTTDRLARTLQLAPVGISAQLHRLVLAGMATKTRVGREVYYARTTRVDQLLD